MLVFALLLVCLASCGSKAASTIYNTCPSEVLHKVGAYYLKVYNGSCFHFVVYKWKTYDDADGDCLNSGGTLALPKTQAMNDYLADQLLNFYQRTDEIWIGLHDKNSEGDFEWEDETEVKWTNFAPGNGPDNSWYRSPLEDCVAINPLDNGLWHDYQCHENLLAVFTGSEPMKTYICQYTPDHVSTVPPITTGVTTTVPTTSTATTVPTTATATTVPTTAPATTVPTTSTATTVPTTAPATTVPTTAPATTVLTTRRQGGEPKPDSYTTDTGDNSLN